MFLSYLHVMHDVASTRLQIEGGGRVLANRGLPHQSAHTSINTNHL